MAGAVAVEGVSNAAATITYITSADVQHLLGCKDNKAYQAIREVNSEARKRGLFAYGQGKASKYLFSEKFGIPIEVVNAVIAQNKNN